MYRDEPAPDNNNNIIDYPANNNNSISFKFKQQITGKLETVTVPLKHLNNFWRVLAMPLINCEISLQLKWSKDCFLVAGTIANQVPTSTLTDTKCYVPVVTLSSQDNVKLLKQLESGFKRTINWNKYTFKKTNQAQNRHLDFLIDSSF